jgi:hypothetical protein
VVSSRLKLDPPFLRTFSDQLSRGDPATCLQTSLQPKNGLWVVLSNTTPPLRVPDYQRDFSWEGQQITEFWTDLDQFDKQYPGANINGKEYFLGATVFVNNQTFNLILDGQQRLATATILLAALRDKIRGFNENAANQIQSNFISFEDHLTGERLPKLQLNQFDRAFFRDSIQSFPRVAAAPTKRSHKLILKAYDYLAECIQKGWEGSGGGENGFKWAARLSKTLTDHVSLVAVISTDEDNAGCPIRRVCVWGFWPLLSFPQVVRMALK